MEQVRARRTTVGWGNVVLAALALRPLVRGVLFTSGAVLLGRALTNIPLKRLFGVGADPGAVSLRKTLTVAAPVAEVFDVWSRPQNFPRFMTHVEDVHIMSDRRSRWSVRGPGGLPVHWETELVAVVPHQLIAWRTVAGSPVEHRGSVRFHPTTQDETQIDVRMSYTPPAGAVGHGLAAALGADPQQAMDDDLVRFKSLLENGRTRARGRPVRREEVA
jgi:uncharacterized membrane protein